MMTRLYSSTVLGVDGVEVEVEVDFRPMAEKRTFIVGLPDAAVKESGQRLDTAIQNSGLPFQQGVFVVNLAPADLRKQGPGFDLPIALGMVAGAAERDMDASSWCIVGELALDGAVRPVQGILPQIMEARRMGRKHIMLPRANAHEGTPVQGVEIYPVASLKEAWALLTSSVLPPPFTASGREDREAEDKEAAVDFDEIKGQPYARRAMEIAAAGGHNILLCGSPGSGKSMLAQRLPTILPPLNPEEALETSKIHSVCGLLKRGNGLVARRPFRAPHHTISDAGLMGGGANITPGEVSLAHNGVLFLDELPEFRRAALETLRQPLESGQVVISRASGTMTFPCRFMLAAAMNPCPCGYLGDRRRTCTCPPVQVARYRRKISGPLLDRFDLLMEVPAVDPSILASAPAGECSAGIRERVMAARQLQCSRYAGTPFRSNAALSGKALQRHCRLLPESRAILLRAVEELALSARAYDRILKVARTIADLEGSPDIQDSHLYEAVQYRAFEHSLRE